MIYLTSLSPLKLPVYDLKDQKETNGRRGCNHRAVATVYVSLIIRNQIFFFLLLITVVMLEHYSVSVRPGGNLLLQ